MRGEVQHTFDELEGRHYELGEFLQDPSYYRLITDSLSVCPRLTIFDSTGCAAQDVMIAKRMLEILDKL